MTELKKQLRQLMTTARPETTLLKALNHDGITSDDALVICQKLAATTAGNKKLSNMPSRRS